MASCRFRGYQVVMAVVSDEVICRKGRDSIKLECDSWSLRLSWHGYWCTFRQGDRFYRRCIDGSVVEGSKQLNTCEPEVADSIVSAVQQCLHQYAISAGSSAWLETALGRTCQDYSYQQQLFQQLYPEGIPILPPDRYRDLVVHPAYGCPNRKCTFCIFYRDKPFSPLSLDGFKKHWEQLQQFWGPEFYQRDGLFLGSANALALSQRRLVEVLEFISQQPLKLKRGISSFLDSDYAPARSPEQWLQLHQLGLRHLVIGLETGSTRLRQELGKSGSLERVTEDVRNAAEAGVASGLTVLVGAAGKSGSKSHIQHSCEYIHSLGLGRKDRVYLSLFEPPVTDFNTGQRESDKDWMQRELESFKVQLGRLSDARVSAYPVSGYRYFA
ncbi:radical SAM protein [Endozoicomonadaceae bacterium StTr2]